MLTDIRVRGAKCGGCLLLALLLATHAAAAQTVNGSGALALAALVGNVAPAEIGVQPDGAAGSLLNLKCTIDPNELKQKSGGGAKCQYAPAN